MYAALSSNSPFSRIETHGTLPTALRKVAERPCKSAGVISDHRTLSYAELDIAARRLARTLIASGVSPGDRIALHRRNGAELIIGYFACFYAGAIAVPVNTRFKAAEIEYVLGHSGASIYIGEPELFKEIEGIRPRLATVRRFIVEPGDFDDCQHLAVLAALPIVAADRPAVILYTSGSAARPKGVVHTHRTLLSAARGVGLKENDVAVIATPMVHAAGLVTLIACVDAAAGAALVAGFEPDTVLDTIERHRGTFLVGMPVGYRALIDAQSSRPRDLPAATRYLASGDSVPPGLKEDFARCFGRPLREAFGTTETGLIAVSGCVAASRLDTFGRAIPGVEIAVTDENGAPAPLGATGEMIVRSPALMVGYWNNPAASEAAFTDGWYRTGDLVSEDFDGNLHFHGRKKDVIVRGGSNLSPQEIEAALYEHPAVLEAGVVGEPDLLWGQRVVAFVARRPGHRVAAAELTAFVAARVAAYRVPEEIVFLGVLPKSATGKILRRALRKPGDLNPPRAAPASAVTERPAAAIEPVATSEPAVEQDAPARTSAPYGDGEALWRWFVVAWLAAGYVLTGVAYFLG
jgi:long-chain acyl-CoA synthetase